MYLGTIALGVFSWEVRSFEKQQQSAPEKLGFEADPVYTVVNTL